MGVGIYYLQARALVRTTMNVDEYAPWDDPDVVEKFDKRRGRPYYWNRVTGKTGWSPEEVSSAPPPQSDPDPDDRQHERRSSNSQHGAGGRAGGRGGLTKMEKALLEVEERAGR